MKNIHIIPTDESLKKRGDLVQDKFGTIHIFTINDGEEYGKTTTKLHIYITSEEEIKENDWFLDITDNTLWKNQVNEGMSKTLFPECGKIILTTDQKLIADGIQDIHDEFLEWFVKNPTCEYVHLGFTSRSGIKEYKTIIPEEEFEEDVECNMCGGSMCLLSDESIYVCTNFECTRCYEEPENQDDEEPKQVKYTEDEVRELIIKALTHDDYMFCGSLVTKGNEIRTANFNIWFEEYKKK